MEDENARIQKAELKSQFDELEDRIAEQNNADIEAWQELVAVHLNINDMSSVDKKQISDC